LTAGLKAGLMALSWAELLVEKTADYLAVLMVVMMDDCLEV
jgi:hypothetical protein